MIDIKQLIANPEKFKQAMLNRGYDAAVVDTLIELHNQSKEAKQKLEFIRAERNRISKQMAKTKSQKA